MVKNFECRHIVFNEVFLDCFWEIHKKIEPSTRTIIKKTSQNKQANQVKHF